MDEQTLWDNFKKTGHIADYLRYRGVDIYAAQNIATERESSAHAGSTGEPHPRDRGSYHSGI